MRFMLAALVLALGLTACDSADRERTAVVKDTIVTNRTVEDTAVVTKQRTVDVDVDTNHTGQGVVGRDTMKH